MTTTQLITSNDPSGQDAVAKFCVAYNKMGFNPEAAQRLNESGEFWQGLKTLMGQHSVNNQFASEEVPSNHTYPEEYRGLKPIGEQVDLIAKAFDLSLGYTSEWVEKVMPMISLPDGAEGWCAVPSVDAVARRHFPEITDSRRKYCLALRMTIGILEKSRRFYNYSRCDGVEMTAYNLRQHDRTLYALDVIAETQKGDILIIPVQYGMRHRGQSVRRARECFTANEFGFNALHVGCLAFTHPERYVRQDQLTAGCPGDEFDLNGHNDFLASSDFSFDGHGLAFSTCVASHANQLSGSVSGFIPQ